ncbi:hypothetical protein NEOLI_005158 [Neolecta irregularis DAH-3]|uniref:Uncharacterized protein n=1 Tax=Neolecta irregularis (strain DAH-3) TaxID=1198029 RepID=A0A1U7LN96_NEOID|nr:hypothetical protein NEOLI_005158 [Neolecta irregularis DAH-3]|eukprot:OLL24098.1 hypothetical protein NEOLI_005158 [Neolecta irregularis DAH-3]
MSSVAMFSINESIWKQSPWEIRKSAINQIIRATRRREKLLQPKSSLNSDVDSTLNGTSIQSPTTPEWKTTLASNEFPFPKKILPSLEKPAPANLQSSLAGRPCVYVNANNGSSQSDISDPSDVSTETSNILNS